MHRFFQGSQYAYGEFTEEGREGKKIIGRCATYRNQVTDELWLRHLNGTSPSIGIIPISEGNDCFWGVIDVDDYELDQGEVLERLKSTPLVACRSKSGGLWLFIFCKDRIPAKVMRRYLVNMSSFLGFGNCEVFPKQEKINPNQGDVGNWLNMPYFGERRCGIVFNNKVEGKVNELNLFDFINYVEGKRVEAKFFNEPGSFDYAASPIEHGPPCLQVMSINGFPEHTRNISLFNVGIYCKKADPEEWQDVLRKYNKHLFSKPLSDKEVDEVIKSLNKKEYNYQCNQEPLVSFCNAPLCRTRKFGISNASSLPIVNSITKIVGDDALWVLDVEGGRLELTTEELYDPRRFGVKCLNNLNIVLPKINIEQWQAWLQAQVSKAIEVREESMFTLDELKMTFTSFVTTRLTSNRDDIMLNRVWYHEESHSVRFKLEAFLSYVRFRKIEAAKNKVVWFLKNRGGATSVSKTLDNKRSYRFTAVHVDGELEELIKEKQAKEEVV